MLRSYEAFYLQYDVALRAGADAATMAGIAFTASLIYAAALPVIITVGVLMFAGAMDKAVLLQYVWRVALVLWLAVSAAFIPYVRDMAVDHIPNDIAASLNANQQMTAVQQFDVLDQAAGNFTSQILGQATGISQVGNKVAAWLARGLQKVFLAATFYIWMGMRFLNYIAIALAAFTLIFILFKVTSGFLVSQMGKIVGLIMWQVSASILLQVMLSGMMVLLRDTIASGASMSIEQQIDVSLSVAEWFFGCFILVLMLPAVIGVGSGVAASSFIASGAMVNASRVMASAGGQMARAAHKVRTGR